MLHQWLVVIVVQADESVACFSEEVADAPVIKAQQLLRNVLSNVPARGETWPALCHILIKWLDIPVLCHTLIEWLDRSSIMAHF